jgi:hypothetical protein
MRDRTDVARRDRAIPRARRAAAERAPRNEDVGSGQFVRLAIGRHLIDELADAPVPKTESTGDVKV